MKEYDFKNGDYVELGKDQTKVVLKRTRKSNGLTYFDVILVLDGKDFLLGCKSFYSAKQKGLYACTLREYFN